MIRNDPGMGPNGNSSPGSELSPPKCRNKDGGVNSVFSNAREQSRGGTQEKKKGGWGGGGAFDIRKNDKKKKKPGIGYPRLRQNQKTKME